MSVFNRRSQKLRNTPRLCNTTTGCVWGISIEDFRDLAQAGLVVVDRYGTRIANDLLTDDEAKQDPAYFDRLLDLELALCDREPFLRVGGMWQLVAERPA